jgi:mycothiol synthase
METAPELPPGYRLRAPNVDEISDVNRLSATCDAALGALPVLSEDLIHMFWTLPRFVLATDAWVVEHEQGLVAYAQVWDEHPTRLSGFAVVHPDHTGRGIGSALAGLIEDRATEKASGDARLFSAAIREDGAAADLLAARGYEWARRFWHMEVELENGLQPSASPPGIELRPLDPANHLPAAHRILEEAFADHWDYSPTPYEEFLERSVNRDHFDPTLWIVAVEAGDPVGVIYASVEDDRGWVNELGVLRSHRGRGIATALLRESFAEFKRRGKARVRLNVDSDNLTGAVSLYESVGMKPVTSYDLWARAIDGSLD